MAFEEESTLKRQEILHELDLEIAQIQKETERPGWTIWAILSALATSIWLLLDIIEKTQFSLQEGLFIFFIISISFDFLFLANQFLQTGTTNATNNKIRFSNELSRHRSLVLLSASRIIILLYICYIFEKSIPAPALIFKLFYLFYGSYLFLLFLIIILSFAKIPVLKNTKSTKVTILYLVICIGLIILIIGFSKSLFEAIPLSMSIFRFGGLLWVVSFLIISFGKGSLRPFLLDTLIEIRRDLIFEKIDVLSASKQFDIALSGLEVSDLLQKEIREILHTYDLISKVFKTMDEKLKQVKNLEKKKDLELLKENDLKIIKTSLEDIESHYKEINILISTLEERIVKHAKYIKKFLLFYPQLEENLFDHKKKLVEIIGSLKEENNIFHKQYYSYMEIFSKLLEKQSNC